MLNFKRSVEERRSPLSSRVFTIGWAGVAALVLLRIVVGWHFLYQGIWKLKEPDFTADAFLLQAKGPLAPQFRSLVPDADGRKRLGEKGEKARLDAWEAYRKEFVAHYGLSAERQKEVDAAFARRSAELQDYYKSIAGETATWLRESDRLQEWEQAPGAAVDYNQRRAWDKRQELTKQAGPWLADLDGIERKFKLDLEATLLPAELAKPLPAKPSMHERMNQVVIWTNIAIGACLIVGLFTRLSAWGGAAFLLLIVLAQPAWPSIYPPAHPSAGQALIVNKEFVEMTALVALGCLPVGRWGGLDFFIHHLILQPLFGSED